MFHELRTNAALSAPALEHANRLLRQFPLTESDSRCYKAWGIGVGATAILLNLHDDFLGQVFFHRDQIDALAFETCMLLGFIDTKFNENGIPPGWLQWMSNGQRQAELPSMIAGLAMEYIGTPTGAKVWLQLHRSLRILAYNTYRLEELAHLAGPEHQGKPVNELLLEFQDALDEFLMPLDMDLVDDVAAIAMEQSAVALDFDEEGPQAAAIEPASPARGPGLGPLEGPSAQQGKERPSRKERRAQKLADSKHAEARRDGKQSQRSQQKAPAVHAPAASRRREPVMHAPEIKEPRPTPRTGRCPNPKSHFHPGEMKAMSGEEVRKRREVFKARALDMIGPYDKWTPELRARLLESRAQRIERERRRLGGGS